MTDPEIDNLLASKLMKWTHVANDNMSKTDETVFMFWKDKTVLKGKPYDATENWPQSERKEFLKKHKVRFDHKFDSWSPTRNIADAFEVLEKLREKSSNFALCADNGWGAHIWHINQHGTEVGRRSAHGETPQMAICNLAITILGRK